MKFRTIGATCAAFAFWMVMPATAGDSKVESVSKNFAAPITNIPGKSLVAVEVNYAPGQTSVPQGPGRLRVQDEAASSAGS